MKIPRNLESLDPQGIEEIFVIKTQEIDFFGAMVREKGGKSAVNGRVCFPDGTHWYFQSSNGNRSGLKKQLTSICETVAAFYHTDVFQLKFQKVVGYEEFIRVLREAKEGMACA